ncbi:MAG: phosphonate metabolism protein/1,5-bisphosphokinase (PRPP-forming) PhnN [Shinella sp.]|nr:phosphonate metabolism protein/1,5-bisphosphokinase (PRPP-forming) PhnN [Shinella sp.]
MNGTAQEAPPHRPGARPTAEGTMVVVVGPSGAGKDSVMNFAARHFEGEPRLVFARRVITRAADAGGEDHDSVGEDEFERLRDAGRFAVSWKAHGLSYGIPAEAQAALRKGRTVVANGSRSALPHFSAVFPRLRVVMITARPEILAQRLAARGRESEDAIAARLGRRPERFSPECGITVIDNSGALEEAGSVFVGLIEGLLSGRG